MKLSVWAKKYGISYQTAWRWFRAGNFPPGITMTQVPTGTIIVNEAQEAGQNVALYGRIVSPRQRSELEAQLGRLATYAAANGWTVVQTAADVGQDDENLPELSKLLANPAITGIVVENRDRLMRHGLGYVESALGAQGRKLIIVEGLKMKGETKGKKK
jgi:putative resolvase